MAVNNGSDVPQTVSAPNATPARQLTFHIVDCAMGTGKSENLLDRARFNGSAMYIRYPEEVERLRRNGWKGEFKGERCIIFVSTIKERDERFVQKLDMATPGKYPYNRSILELIRSGKNIITTQALWSIFNEETIAAFKESDYLYTAFFDEVPPLFREVVGNGRKRDDFGELVAFGPADVKLMQEAEILVNVKGQLRFNAKCEYNKKNSEHKVFNAVKQLSRSCNLYPYGGKDGKYTSIVAFARKDLFDCFEQCWFFSYRTWNSIFHKYCLLNGIRMEYYHILDLRAMRNPGGKYVETYPEGMERLVILDDENVNFGASLSKEWFKRARGDASGSLVKSLKGCFRSAYKIMKRHGVTSRTFMFTTFTDYRNLLQSDGRHFPTLKRFLPCNTKATNDYSDCTGVAYLCNRFFDVTCCNFLSQKAEETGNPDLKFDNDNYALSELLQFIWRSNVRVKESDKPVYVWVPDKRMRKLLQDFQTRALEKREAVEQFLLEEDRRTIEETREKRKSRELG